MLESQSKAQKTQIIG